MRLILSAVEQDYSLPVLSTADRVVHNATWTEVGDINMRERLSGRKDG